MKLQNYCTVEQSKKLEELGIKGKSDVYHIYRSKWELVPTGYFYEDEEGIDLYNAWGVAELGVMLPHPQTLSEMGGWVHPSEFDKSESDGRKWYMIWEWEKDNGTHDRKLIDGVTEAEARAAMLIYLLENKLITADEVNARLTSNQP